MLLFEGPASTFVPDAENGSLASFLVQRFRMHMGHAPGLPEIRAWRNSLKAFAARLDGSVDATAHVLVEYQLPLSSSRLDCMVLGHSDAGAPHAEVVELKQWDGADESPFEDCVRVFGEHRLHPSAQVGGYVQYLRDCLSIFQEGGISIDGCAYLHNLRSAQTSILTLDRYQPLLNDYPLFDAANEAVLSDKLNERCGAGKGEALAAKVIKSRYRPSPKLLEHTARMIDGNSVYTLLDSQQVAYNGVKTAVTRGLEGQDKAVFVIEGGPGTGKSVIAMRLLADMARRNYKVNHATGSKAFTTNVRACVGRRAEKLFQYFDAYTKSGPNALDLLVCDEAHRIRENSSSRWRGRSDRPQIDELLASARVSVMFLDANQSVRPGEVGSTQLIRDAARRIGLEPVVLSLDSQFRCAGGQSYIEWVEGALGIRDDLNHGWQEAGEYEFHLVESPGEMESLLRRRIDQGFSARMVAGYCWPWARVPGLDLPDEVVIGDWKKPWNPSKIGSTAATDAYTVWATKPQGFEQVGCIYSAQGFEWDYAGVIIGPDLLRRGGAWQANREGSQDDYGARNERDPAKLLKILQNTYRVLLTRGMRGCFLHCTDDETREWFRTVLTR